MGLSYAAPADLILRFDARLVGQLVGDANQTVTPAQLSSDSATQAALDDATGIINAALYVAYKYTAAQIATTSPESLSMLKWLCCCIAIVNLCQRRGWDYADKFPMTEDAMTMLQQLRYGERVLDIGGNEQAGLAASTQVTIAQQRRIGLVVANPNIFPLGGRFGGNSNVPVW